jgi:hypothetical protein
LHYEEHSDVMATIKTLYVVEKSASIASIVVALRIVRPCTSVMTLAAVVRSCGIFAGFLG